MPPSTAQRAELRRRRSLGREGEAFVASELGRRGFRILERNLRSRGGELDLIALREGILWFVEVKTRISAPPEVSIRQQRCITRMAYHYLAAHPLEFEEASFVVAWVHGRPGAFEVEFIENAFDAAF